MSERPDRDENARSAEGLAEKLRTGQAAAGILVKAAVLFVTAVVFLQIFGVIDSFDDDPADPQRVLRLPAEYLYLDDERVDAYLGQLKGGLAPTETQSVRVTRTRNAELALQQVVQVGGNVEEQRLVERTVSSRAADRYYLLEAELAARFADADRLGLRFRDVEANAGGCRQIATGAVIKPGQMVRILGAHLRVPTYALALSKVAHAAQFVAPRQAEGVPPERLSRLAERSQPSLGRFVRSFGANPRLPFRLEIGHSGRLCTIFMPARYSKLVESPSLLTGRVTVVGKVVRSLTGESKIYFDVETAARYGRAVVRAEPAVKDVLALRGVAAREVVHASARVSSPALVILPIAIYK